MSIGSTSTPAGGLDVAPRQTWGSWDGPPDTVSFDARDIAATLRDLAQPCYVVQMGDCVGISRAGSPVPSCGGAYPLLALAAPIAAPYLGDSSFQETYGAVWSYMAGSMANGIASAELVSALGRAGILGSYGAAGLDPNGLEEGIRRVQSVLPRGPYAFNLIHSPSEEAIERRAVELYLQRGVTVVEASAFLDLTAHIVRYRVAGLALDPAQRICIGNKVIAKVSRREVAEKFLSPAPPRLLEPLVRAGLITELQARLAAAVPMCDDVTVEADSAGHTDNRPLVCLLPSIVALRDEVQARHRYANPVRVGAAGGIGTPEAALAAFAMGAAYVVTGSINQACVESGTSEQARSMLAGADMADVVMAPAADMFEMGVKLQLLKRGTLFPMRAQRLYELYRTYDSLEEIPHSERVKLEQQVFRQSIDSVWEQTASFFADRDPAQVERAEGHPKRRMALVFRWYLGMASRWAIKGEHGREGDYQIWCGPAMGAFNDWVRGSYLEEPAERRVTDVAHHIMTGAAYLSRLHTLRAQGVQLAPQDRRYRPERINPSI